MSQNRSRIDPAIIAAIIGVLGTLCVTLITLYANYFGPWPHPTAVGQPLGLHKEIVKDAIFRVVDGLHIGYASVAVE